MIHAKNMLIVEGETDKKFMHRFCKITLQTAVEVVLATPEDFHTDDTQNTGNGKRGVYQILEDLIPNIMDSSEPLQNLGVIVDADHCKDGDGFQKTLDHISTILQQFDFQHDADYQQGGFVFKHSDEGVHSVGVWIMPNNADDGAIESWIGQCVDAEKCHLLPHAQTVVKNLPNRTFSGNHQQKAEIATWLAWQKRPSIGLYAAVPFLNEQAADYQQLQHWLEAVFKD